MRKHAGFLALVLFCSASLRGESVWTGNASVGDPLRFPGSREYFRAASNSFPLGTVLEVTNPKGRASVNVVVVDRLESPGIFLLMEMNAAKLIRIPSDHIHPVQVTPIGSSDIDIYASIDSSELGDEEDHGSAESLPDDQIPAYPSDSESDISTDSSPEENPVVPAAIVTEPVMIDDLGGYNDAGVAMGPVDVYNVDKIRDPSSIVDQATPDIGASPDGAGNLTSAEETDTEAGNLVESGSRVFFLSPSELRPPVGVSIEQPVEQSLMAAREDEFDISRYEIGERGEYIQIGAYRSREVFKARVIDIQQSRPDYPLRVLTVRTSGSPDQLIYKLLLGPIKPAEVGVVLDTVRRNNLSDAFLFVR